MITYKTTYNILASSCILATVITFLSLYISSTVFGLETGSYYTIIDTNKYGENYLEISIVISCIPFALKSIYTTISEIIS